VSTLSLTTWKPLISATSLDTSVPALSSDRLGLAWVAMATTQ
jgi:hypothetical protein